MEPRLKKEFDGLEHTLRRTRLLRELTAGWLAAGTVAILLLLIQVFTGWISQIQWLGPLLIGLAVASVVWKRNFGRRFDSRAIVSVIEREHPESRHLLSAAVEQNPDSRSREYHYLQLRVVDEALQHSRRELWKRTFESELTVAKRKNMAAAGTFLILLLAVGFGPVRAHPILSVRRGPEITVTPGDTEVERGTTLVISARFDTKAPAEARLVLLAASGKTRYIPLERHLADPVFGASLSEVTEEAIYHVEYAGGKTRDYKISVFDYPALARADAHLRFPDYTHLANRTIPDTLRVTAVEGTRLTYILHLNKAVTHARLISSRQRLDLELTNDSVAILNDFPVTGSDRYSLALEDAQGRTNKFPSDFVIVAVTNQRPELKVLFPRGDQRVSRLEELQVQGEATGEFGLLKYGFGYALAGQDPHLVELGQAAPGRRKCSFNYLLALEKLGVEKDQVVAYFVWADDFGSDGKVRRTFSDIFFAEVRPFEEVFRPDESGAPDGQNSGQPGNRGTELAEMQKEIIVATWKLQQEKSQAATTKMP